MVPMAYPVLIGDSTLDPRCPFEQYCMGFPGIECTVPNQRE